MVDTYNLMMYHDTDTMKRFSGYMYMALHVHAWHYIGWQLHSPYPLVYTGLGVHM